MFLEDCPLFAIVSKDNAISKSFGSMAMGTLQVFKDIEFFFCVLSDAVPLIVWVSVDSPFKLKNFLVQFLAHLEVSGSSVPLLLGGYPHGLCGDPLRCCILLGREEREGRL